MKEKLVALIDKDRAKAEKLIALAVCLLAALLVTVTACVSSCVQTEEGVDPDASLPLAEGITLTDTVPQGFLPKGLEVLIPSDGKLFAVSVSDLARVLYYEEYPAEALQGYLIGTGLAFPDSAPYVVQKGSRMIAVSYDEETKNLSVTVTEPEETTSKE